MLGQDASTIARDYSAVSVYSIQTTKEFRKLKDHNVDLEHTESILRGPPDPLSGGSLISEPPPQLCGPSCQSSVPPAESRCGRLETSREDRPCRVGFCVLGLQGFRVQSFRVLGLRLLGFRVSGLGPRVEASGLRACGLLDLWELHRWLMEGPGLRVGFVFGSSSALQDPRPSSEYPVSPKGEGIAVFWRGPAAGSLPELPAACHNSRLCDSGLGA